MADVDASVNNLKSIEESRNKSFISNTSTLDVDSGVGSLFLRRANNLSDDLAETLEEGVGDQVDLTQGVVVTRARKKGVCVSRKPRRSARLNKNKKY